MRETQVTPVWVNIASFARGGCGASLLRTLEVHSGRVSGSNVKQGEQNVVR
jgi:hypothetical protein